MGGPVATRERPAPTGLGGYENLEPFRGRSDFFTATRVYPAESATVRSFLLRVAAEQDAEAVARLLRQAKLLAQLQSPCIPRLTDMGHHDGRWYLAFLIDSPLRMLPVPGGDGSAIVRHLAEALGHMHDHGLAHRGLCPSAVALNPTGTPLLFDLWWLGRFKADRMVRSVLGRRPRTPYDAPEAGAAEFDGVRADIYSLGVLSRELLPAHDMPASWRA